MCGLSGILHWDRGPVQTEELEEMARRLRHRGPDQQTVARPSDGVGLSHTRLSVIDLSPAASQPMANEEKTIWLCFNGEIYNFQDLRRELEAGGARFRSRSDTEVILRAYERWGTEAIRQLDGMFALSIWDSSRRELLLARDRTGKKPLYYWTNGRCLAFASEIKALWAHPHVPKEINEGILEPLLTFGYPPAGETCYKGIRQVLPATFICFRAEEPEPSPHRYWSLPPPPSRERAASNLAEGEVARQLRDLLTQAVRRRLISDVPLGAFLSGGLDSSIVANILSKEIPAGRVRTFSIGFEGDSRYNETHFAEIAAARFRTQHTVFTVTTQSFGLLEKLVWHHDQPFGDSSAVPTYLLSQLARSQVTVALTGDGGDELFAGYDRFFASLLAEKIPLPLRSMVSRLASGLPSGASQKSLWTRLRRFCLSAQRPLPERLLSWSSYFQNARKILQPGVPLRGSALTEIFPAAGQGESSLQRILRMNFQDYLPNDLHVKLDRCSMAHGLETRSPFLDTRLIEWSFSLPDRYKLRGGIPKWILRRAFQEELPPAILTRKKMGFGVPLEEWFRGPWKEPLHDLLAAGQPRVTRYIKPEALQTLMFRHQKGWEDAGQKLWLLLTLEIWLRGGGP